MAGGGGETHLLHKMLYNNLHFGCRSVIYVFMLAYHHENIAVVILAECLIWYDTSYVSVF